MATKTHNTATGRIGEAVAVQYLRQQGWTIRERNRHFGFAEIDIIAEHCEIIHFIEVKTVSYETRSDLHRALQIASWRPEDQVHEKKLAKLGKAAEVWLQSTGDTKNWQIDVIGVRIVPRETYATINHIENVIQN